MTDKEALSWVNAMRLDNNDSTNCAADLCVHDIEAYGLKDWILWDPIDISKIFSEILNDSVKDLIDEIDSQQAGEVLIDELLESEQERIDTLYESKKIALASTKMMNVLTKYHSIHEFIKAQIDEQDNTY
tara:strand:+ start:1067 stop:1456 length:390 start_codon:yes stop_codon:yes gene_type:complete